MHAADHWRRRYAEFLLAVAGAGSGGAFERIVDEGEARLGRPLLAMCATGILGGIDVGTGVLFYLLVHDATGSTLLAGPAFPVGFVALLLARSELFTENFLVPVLTVTARRAHKRTLARLWALTLATNMFVAG